MKHSNSEQHYCAHWAFPVLHSAGSFFYHSHALTCVSLQEHFTYHDRKPQSMQVCHQRCCWRTTKAWNQWKCSMFWGHERWDAVCSLTFPSNQGCLELKKKNQIRIRLTKLNQLIHPVQLTLQLKRFSLHQPSKPDSQQTWGCNLN